MTVVPPELIGFFAETAKTVAQSAVYDLLKRLFERADESAKKLSAIYNEPLLTGLRYVQDAAGFPVQDKKAAYFGDLLSKSADNLERAISLLSQAQGESEQMMRALCALVWIYAQTPGASHVAQMRAGDLHKLLLATLDPLRESIKNCEHSIEQAYADGPPRRASQMSIWVDDFGHPTPTDETVAMGRKCIDELSEEIRTAEDKFRRGIELLLDKKLLTEIRK